MIEAILGYKSSWRILSLMAEAPRKEFTRNFLKTETALGNQALDNALQRLKRVGILLEERDRYRINGGMPCNGILLELLKEERERLRHLEYHSRIILAELMRKLFEYTIEEAYLFGSHARGTARNDSDIDIACIFTRPPDETQLASVTDWIEKRFSAKVQLHAFSKEDFKEASIARQVREEGISLLLHTSVS
jgi:predicted nucleotidyltransferase